MEIDSQQIKEEFNINNRSENNLVEFKIEKRINVFQRFERDKIHVNRSESKLFDSHTISEKCEKYSDAHFTQQLDSYKIEIYFKN